jgi:hypothetical protein
VVLLAWAGQNGARHLFRNGLEMSLLARSILCGHGLASPFGPPTGPTALIAPVYPMLVAGVFKLCEVESTASAWVILSLHLAANLTAIWLTMWLARRFFGELSELIAGLFQACSPPLLFLPTIFWETSFSIALLIGLLGLAVWLRDRLTAWRWMLFGLYCGVAVLVNPALLLTLVAVGAGTVAVRRRRQGFRWIDALGAVGLSLLVFSAWPIRNARVFHAFIPLRTTVGMELWMGNHAGSTGYLQESLFPTFNPRELAEYKQEGEVAYTDSKTKLAKQYIAAHPGNFAVLSVRRFFRFWLGTGTEHGSLLFALHATMTTAFGLCGLWMLLLERRWEVVLLLATPLLLFPLPYYITHAEFRYRIVIDPVLVLLASYAVARFSRRKDGKSKVATG